MMFSNNIPEFIMYDIRLRVASNIKTQIIVFWSLYGGGKKIY